MTEHRVFLAYDNCCFNNGNCCAVCARRFESGGIEAGFELAENGKIESDACICPECLKKGPAGWKEQLLERAQQEREYAKVAEQQLLARAAKLEKFAKDTFILPTEEEEQAVRAEWPGEWCLTEREETEEQGVTKRTFYAVSLHGKRLGVEAVEHIYPDGTLIHNPQGPRDLDDDIPF